MKNLTAFLLFFVLRTYAQDTVVVNPAIQYQTIKGWGGTGGQNTQYEGTPPYLINQIINESVDGLGLTGLRYECFQGSYSQSYAKCHTWEWTNDNGSPDTTLFTSFDTTGVDYYMQNLFVPWKNKVVGNGEPFTFYESPSWYYSGSTGDIPAFLRYSPGEYSEYLISNLLYLKNKYGLTADYVTVCNEAGNSNVFTPQLVDTMIQTLGKRLQLSGLSTTIQFPECVNAQTSWDYIQALQGDPLIWPYIKCLSYHLYGTNDPYRSYIKNFAQGKGIYTAQTEYLGLGIDLLYQDLTLGGVSYWDFYGNTDYMPLNANNTWFTHGAKFWTTRQVIRHVRPGAVRIDAVCKDATIKPMAFLNGGQITTIILNDSATSITQPVTITGLPAGNYGVSQTTGSGTYSELGVSAVGVAGTLTLTVNAQTVLSVYPHTVNLPPVATTWAANPAFLDLPASSVALSSAAIDPELSTIAYHWTIDSFPTGANVIISNANISNPTATGLTVAGNYVFGMHFSDGTNTTTKQVTVQVFPNNQAPVISALQSRIPVLVTLPVDTTVLQGAAFDLEGDALTMQFSVISQPAGASAQLTNVQTAGNTVRNTAKNMTVAGDYTFRFTVFDATHTVYRDIVVTVFPLNNAPEITSVSANPALTTLPADSSHLSAVTSDPDGDVITHWWTVKSVPTGAAPTFSAQGERLTSVNNLTVPGIYVFILTLVDRTLYTTKEDTVIVTNVLPLNIISFKGRVINSSTTEVQWETASEINASYFTIQRSADGNRFTTIGKVAEAGNNAATHDYIFTDASVLQAGSSVVYYRLTSTDKNDHASVSNVVSLNLGPAAPGITVSPNPSTDILNIEINNLSGNASINIFDVKGRKIQQLSKTVQDKMIIAVPTSAFAKGSYFVKILVDAKVYNQKFIKE
jgi:Secretion system C-terminal sorting domain